MSNTNAPLLAFKNKVLEIETRKREAAEDMRDLRTEMKSAGVAPHEIAGIMLAVRRSFESDEKTAKRTAAEEVADMLGASGDAPLFAER
jgi:hypothetical protein